jgi:anti-sigma B factor antagonist
MKVEQRSRGCLKVSGIHELSAVNAREVRDAIVTTLESDLKDVDVDLSETVFLDSCGIGALISVYKEINKRQGQFRVLHPTARAEQILDLTRMGQLFTIVKKQDLCDLPATPMSAA